jgi:glutathione synthase/RimK-type ligase-like ATP-grasp enzyme
MPAQIVVVEQKGDWKAHFPDTVVVLAKDYVSKQEFFKQKDTRVINLCRSYRYLSIGYYVSLLAEARYHRVIPSVRTITDLKSKSIYSLSIEDLHETVQKNIKKIPGETSVASFVINIYFGQCEDNLFSDLCRQLFDYFRSPILRAEFKLTGKWQIASIRPGNIQYLNPMQEKFFINAFNQYIVRRWSTPKAKSISRYDMAILYNPDEKLPPSNFKALKKFIKAAEKLGLEAELITKKDFSRLAEYDALFIRETTEIEHHTYRFARRAANDGIIVIDDPDSIMKCTNKIYLAELLTANKIPVPITEILKKDENEDLKLLEKKLSYPIVLKIPDSSFSRGIHKANNTDELKKFTQELFSESDVIIAQEYLYTEFDWRIVILNQKPVLACQYFMSRHHWQIVKHGPEGKFIEGSVKTWRIEDTPQDVVKIAMQAANLIGNGLYGVDIKQSGNRIVVMEINDNPNIDAGVEDKILGDELYNLVVKEFIRRLDAYMEINQG